LGVVGDHIHPREAELDGLDFAISMDRGTAPRDLWLRLKSSSTRQLHAQVFSFDEWERTSLMQQLVFSVYVALISMFAIWGITAWLFSRERLMVAFGLKQFAALVFSLAALGYLRVFWPASWPAAWLHQLTSAFSVLAVSAALVFHILFTSEFQLRRWVKVWYALALWLQLLKLGLLAAGQTVLALQINMTEVLIYPVLFLLALVSARAWAEPAGPPPLLNRPLVIGIYTLVWLAMLGPALTGLALRAGSETSLYFVQAHGLFTAGLLLIALQYRQRFGRALGQPQRLGQQVPAVQVFRIDADGRLRNLDGHGVIGLPELRIARHEQPIGIGRVALQIALGQAEHAGPVGFFVQVIELLATFPIATAIRQQA
jgi:hypothetical protein